MKPKEPRAAFIFDIPLRKLTGVFNVTRGLMRVDISTALYDEFLDTYHRALQFSKKWKDVVESQEHQLIMAEGRGRYILPPDDFLSYKMERLDETLCSFNPYRFQKGRDGQVNLSAAQIQGFFNTFVHGYDAIHDTFEMLRATDYMKYMKHLRANPYLSYNGPTSLPEVVRLYFGLARAAKAQKIHLENLLGQRDAALEPKVDRAMQPGAAGSVAREMERAFQGPPQPKYEFYG